MRCTALVLVFLVGCGDSTSDTLAASCPDQVLLGQSCAVVPDLTCLSSGSTCGAGWGQSSFVACRCQDGVWTNVDYGPYPFDGAPCDPLYEGSGCAREGPPGCSDPQPPGAYCTCTDQTWHCSTSCVSSCPTTYNPALVGMSCVFTGDCTYDGHVCSCSTGTFTCT